MSNIDQNEIHKFNQLASRWWDKQGNFKPLHEINPLRLQFIAERTSLQDEKVIDIGCGGGILSESLALRGAKVTGIDLAPDVLQVAKLHALESGLSVHYEFISAEKMAEKMPGAFNCVTCMELLEHVPDPSSLIKACAELVKPGGDVFFSTINRNPKAYLFAVVGAEYILKLLPKGTHDYKKFIKPSELDQWLRKAGLKLKEFKGMTYNPLKKTYQLTDDISVNYLAHCQRID